MAKKQDDRQENPDLENELKREEQEWANWVAEESPAPVFTVTRAPNPVFGFYAVTKGEAFQSNTVEKRFVSVDDWNRELPQKDISEAEWDSLLVPQDFSQLPVFQQLYAALPEAVNIVLWRYGIFAQPMLNNKVGRENIVARFRQLLEQAIHEALNQ